MTQAPIAAAFETQRTAIESAKTAADIGLQYQQSLVSAYLGGLESTKAIQQSGVDLSKRTANAWIEALESSAPSSVVSQLQEAVDDSFAAFEDGHEAAWDEFEASLAAYQDVADDITESQQRLIQESVDDLLAAQEDAEAALVEATEAVETVVAETQDAVEQAVDNE